jgi:hypothetical protein
MYHMYNCPEWDGRIPKFFKNTGVMNQALLSSFVIFFIYGIVENVIIEGTVQAIAGFKKFKDSAEDCSPAHQSRIEN